ncbi:hypothetical protein [Nocardioides sp. 503]|uniref:hypothetical protein n=1 Tax=Nocardioides sp. 503 TaxID=2508326 RepID=UPI00107068FE|nr:hypothetical protein [Nocardioides sp. 503]
MNTLLDPDLVEQRLRRTLRTVAGTVTEDQAFGAGRAPVVRRSHRGRWIGLGIVAVAVPVTLAAAAVVRQGPEYVDTIPPEQVVMSGSVDGSRYLLAETTRTSCGEPLTGVELIEERENLLGSEWNTTLYEYGDTIGLPCGHRIDPTRYLARPALYTDSGVAVGDSFVWVYAVHPDVTGVRITADDYSETLAVYPVDGAGFAPFEIPRDLREYTSELLIDGQVVPGSAETHRVPRDE